MWYGPDVWHPGQAWAFIRRMPGRVTAALPVTPVCPACAPGATCLPASSPLDLTRPGMPHPHHNVPGTGAAACSAVSHQSGCMSVAGALCMCRAHPSLLRTSLMRGRLDRDQDLLERAPPGVGHGIGVILFGEVRPVGGVGWDRGRDVHHVDVFHVLDHLLYHLAAGI